MGLCLALLLIAAPMFNAVWVAAENTPVDETIPVQPPEEPTQPPEEPEMPEEPEEPEGPKEPEMPEEPEDPSEEEQENPPETDEEHTVLLYDVGADGFGEGVPALILSVPDGGTILDALAQTEDSVFADGTAAADCVYYAFDAAGRRTYWELSAPVRQALSLYTYSYTLSVIYDVSISAKDDWNSMDADAPEDGDAYQQVVAVSAREGAPFDAAALWAGKVDLTQLAWTDSQTGRPVSAAELLIWGLRENMEVYAIGIQAATEATVVFYAAVDDAWVELGSTTTSQQASWGSSLRYYLTAEELEAVYAPFGFTAAGFQGELIFPHTDTQNLNTIWADTAPKYDAAAATYRVPLSSRTTSYVFYAPANILGSASYFGTSAPRSDKTVLQENTFYTLSVSDPMGLFAEYALPEQQYVRAGAAYSVTLPLKDGVDWYPVQPDTGLAVPMTTYVDQQAGTITFVQQAMSCSVNMIASAGVTVTYRATASGCLEDISSEYYSGIQEIVDDGTVHGSQTLTENVTDEGSYTILAPDSDRVKVRVEKAEDKNRRFYYSFMGWRVGVTDTILQPGQQLSYEQMVAYADETTHTVTLNAVWKIIDDNSRATSVNFYLNMDCEIMDNMSNGFVSQHMSNFTDAVYATRIFGTNAVAATTHRNVQIIAPPTEADTAYAVDAELRGAVRTPIPPA